MNYIIFQLQMTSASTYFPLAFKTVNYCLMYHTSLALALYMGEVFKNLKVYE